MTDEVTGTIKPELAALLNEDNRLRWKALREDLYNSSPIWRDLMDACGTQPKDG